MRTYSASIIACVILATGCARPVSVPFTVTTRPPGARIAVNRQYVGDSPITIHLMTSQAPGLWKTKGEEYWVRATWPASPLPKLRWHGASMQEQLVDPRASMEGGELFFDLRPKRYTPFIPDGITQQRLECDHRFTGLSELRCPRCGEPI